MLYLLRRAALFSVCAVIVLLACLSAQAAYVPPVGYSSDGTTAVVTINRKTAVEFLKPNGNLTPEARAKLTSDRLQLLAQDGWKSLSIKPLGKKRAQVVAGETVICIATVQDAKAVNMTALNLAQSWAKQMKLLFALPPITLSQSEITIPLNEKRWITVGGVASGAVLTTDGTPLVASSAVDQKSRTVEIYGRGTGQCTIDVATEGCCKTINVYVKKYAAKLKDRTSIEVTGNPAPSELLEEVALLAAPQTIDLEPGAVAEYGKPKFSLDSLDAGKCLLGLVPTRVTGKDLIPVDLLAPVDVVNRRVAYTATSGLFYSNNPETLKRYGVLFEGKLQPNERHRLLYHHQNAIGRRARLQIELINAGSTTATIQTVSGVSQPMVDTVMVGYDAGKAFLRYFLGDVGRIHSIPARSKLIIYSDDLGNMTTASGIIDMRLLTGDDVYVRVAARSPASGEAHSGDIVAISTSDVPTKLSDQVYLSPNMDVDASYTVGQQWAFIRIGKYGITDASQQQQLFGNYGVIYRVKIHVENPTAEKRKIKLMFEPTAGPAAGVFVMNGTLTGTKTVMPPKEYEVGSMSIGPGASKDFTLMTMPLAGSAYPATIIVKS